MKIIEMIQGLLFGENQAELDIVAHKAMKAEHARLHKEDEDYDCNNFFEDFYSNVGKSVEDSDNAYAKAIYRYRIREYYEEIAAESMHPDIEIMHIESDGIENIDDFHRRVMQAIATNEEFKKVVSETETENDQKGGK